MITFRIVILRPYKDISLRLKEDAREINKNIFHTLTRYGVDEETAIDCASWGELATIGESYNTENFDVYVEE